MSGKKEGEKQIGRGWLFGDPVKKNRHESQKQGRKGRSVEGRRKSVCQKRKSFRCALLRPVKVRQ